MAWPNDGPSWSPDGGEYWVKDRVCYFADGEILDPGRDGFVAIRSMDSVNKTQEDFSAWSEEKRADVRAKWAVIREKARILAEAREANRAAQEVLLNDILSRLTPLEIEVLEDHYRDRFGD